MKGQLLHLVPFKLGEQHVRMKGTVVVQVRFEPTGIVGCAKVVSGHPLAVARAMEAVPKWTFKPIVRQQKLYGGCGLIKIRYSMSDHQEKTSVR
jgi:hypothetical protein